MLVKRNLFSTILKNVMAVGASSNADFPVVVRICHILLELLRMVVDMNETGSGKDKNFLRKELSHVLSYMLDLLDPAKPQLRIWQRTLFLEFFNALCAEDKILLQMKQLTYAPAGAMHSISAFYSGQNVDPLNEPPPGYA